MALVSRRSAVFCALAAGASALAGCDTWPTAAVNRSMLDVEFRWRHKDYSEWSSWFHLPAGKSSLLARGHYVADFMGIEVRDAGQSYQVAPSEMQAFRQLCKRAAWGACAILYDGAGRISVEPWRKILERGRDGKLKVRTSAAN